MHSAYSLGRLYLFIRGFLINEKRAALIYSLLRSVAQVAIRCVMT